MNEDNRYLGIAMIWDDCIMIGGVTIYRKNIKKMDKESKQKIIDNYMKTRRS